MQVNEEAQRDELFGQASAPKSGRVNIEERRRQRAAAQRSAASRIGEGLAGAFSDTEQQLQTSVCSAHEK